MGRAIALGLSLQTRQEVTWSRGQFVIDGTAVSSPDAVLGIATAVRLGQVRRAHRGWAIGQNPDPPYRWEAWRWVSATSWSFTHAATLDELDALLPVDPS